MNTPTTPTPDTPPVQALAETWFSWVAFTARGGSGAVEMSQSERITCGEHIAALQETLAEHAGLPTVVVTAFTLLRVEDAAGRVIG